jgi:hypothetical protein
MIVVVGIVILLAAAALMLSPMGPGPELPAGATRLHIATVGASALFLGRPLAPTL